VLRQARRRAARRPFTDGSARRVRRTISGAAALLAWLDEQNLTLHSAGQSDIDRWLERPGGGDQVTGFLRWARRHGLAGDFDISYRQQPEPAITMSDGRRWQLLSRCLTDPAVPVDVRAAGALVLLYGLPVSRLVELAADQLIRDGGQHYLQIGLHRTVLPPSVAALLDHVPTAAATALVATGERQWLFPGQHAGRQRSASSMQQRLRRHGINVRAARNAALIGLAAEVPPRVLADVLGISITNAEQWARRAARNWHGYLHTRLDYDHGVVPPGSGRPRRPGSDAGQRGQAESGADAEYPQHGPLQSEDQH
jgi:hypothetical protein